MRYFIGFGLILLFLAVLLSILFTPPLDSQITYPPAVLTGTPPGGVGAPCTAPVPMYANLLTGEISSCLDGRYVVLAPSTAAGLLTYFFVNAASSIGGGYKQAVALGNFTPGSQAELDIEGVTDGQVLATFATNSGFPGVTFIPDGVFHVHMVGKKTATGSGYLTAKIYKRASGGTETLLVETGPSANLSTAQTGYDIVYTNPNAIALLASDRIVVKIVAHRLTAPLHIYLYIDGQDADQTNSRVELPASAVDVTTFIPYTGATRAVSLGAYALQSGATASDPGCTAAGDIGKQWYDITTDTTVFNVCLNVGGSIGWVAK